MDVRTEQRVKRLYAVLTEIQARNPSIETILRKKGYEYEALLLAELCHAFKCVKEDS
jgi:hypothetical protein